MMPPQQQIWCTATPLLSLSPCFLLSALSFSTPRRVMPRVLHGDRRMQRRMRAVARAAQQAHPQSMALHGMRVAACWHRVCPAAWQHEGCTPAFLQRLPSCTPLALELGCKAVRDSTCPPLPNQHPRHVYALFQPFLAPLPDAITAPAVVLACRTLPAKCETQVRGPVYLAPPVARLPEKYKALRSLSRRSCLRAAMAWIPMPRHGLSNFSPSGTLCAWVCQAWKPLRCQCSPSVRGARQWVAAAGPRCPPAPAAGPACTALPQLEFAGFKCACRVQTETPCLRQIRLPWSCWRPCCWRQPQMCGECGLLHCSAGGQRCACACGWLPQVPGSPLLMHVPLRSTLAILQVQGIQRLRALRP
jgi:hypothetical protein